MRRFSILETYISANVYIEQKNWEDGEFRLHAVEKSKIKFTAIIQSSFGLTHLHAPVSNPSFVLGQSAFQWRSERCVDQSQESI